MYTSILSQVAAAAPIAPHGRWRAGRAGGLLLLLACFAFLASGCGRQQGVARAAGDSDQLVITGITVVDVRTGNRLPNRSVLIAGGRISRITTRAIAPKGAAVLDGRGLFLIPGLWDMHSHNEPLGAGSMDLYLANGVLGTRDMGSEAGFILDLRERVRRGELRGPTIVAAGPILDAAPPEWPFRRTVRSASDARNAVSDLARRGVDFIKVHDSTPRDSFFAIAKEAGARRLPVAGHVPAAVSIEEAVEAGMRSIEHLANGRIHQGCADRQPYSLASCRSRFELLARHKVMQTPTLALYNSMPRMFAEGTIPHGEYATPELLELWRGNRESAKVNARFLAYLRRQNEQNLRAVPDLLATGTRFLAGCDGLVPGFCLHDELEWLNRAGLSPLQALQSATINAAEFLGRSAETGSVEEGMRADLVLLRADPLVAIRNAQTIEAVILGGRVLDRRELDRMLARRRQAGTPTERRDER